MSAPTLPVAGRRIRSVEIAFSIINELQNHERLGVTELANELGHSKSTIHSHLTTLENQRIVVKEDDGYRLGLRILHMARQVREQVGNYSIIQAEVDTLAEETGEVAQFGIQEYDRVMYYYKMAGDRAVQTASDVGKQQPLYSTALGKTILAHLPGDATEQILQSTEFRQFTSNTITDRNSLVEHLDRIQERGYGVDDEENIEGLRCVAAPVTDDDRVLGGVSITGPSSRLTMDRIHGDLSDQVIRAANVIELNTKFS